MKSVENRLGQIEDRFALQDALTAYCTAVDGLNDVDRLLDCFADDAVLDMGGIGLPRFEGRAAIRGCFEKIFADMSHHAHYTTNFAIRRLEHDRADCRAYAIGMGVSNGGQSVLGHVSYALTFVRENARWKIRFLGESALMPLPKEALDIHR